MATILSLIPDNRLSTILTEKENEIIFSLLDTNCRTLSTTLVRLLLCESPEDKLWRISCIGIVCLVKDYDRGMFFIKIFDFIDKRVLWEHQLTYDIEYKCPEPLLLAFETQDSIMVGLNFSVEEEATHFRDTLKRQLFRLKPQTDESAERLVRKSVSKDDINSPTNFRHSLRVFFNPLVGFEVVKPNDKDSNHKKKFNNNSDNSSNELFESEDEIQAEVEEAFQFLNQRGDSICSYDSNISSIVNQRPVPKARTKVGNSFSEKFKSVCVQTDEQHNHNDQDSGQTLYYALVNKFFEPVNHLTPPPIIKAMTYLASHSELDQL